MHNAGDSEVRGLGLCFGQEARSSPSATSWCQLSAMKFSVLRQHLAYFHFIYSVSERVLCASLLS